MFEELLTYNSCAARIFRCLTLFLSRIVLLSDVGSAVKARAYLGHGK